MKIERKQWLKNIPFTASFEINGESEIELVIQVANFQDPRNGGNCTLYKIWTRRCDQSGDTIVHHDAVIRGSGLGPACHLLCYPLFSWK
ncbi:hypothetical protein OL548_21135 [Lysinibacillus sp. MHQ-1]|nr:hypothetical protein OL548_21135 [Lysinibacillus sp. MHQ-1]